MVAILYSINSPTIRATTLEARITGLPVACMTTRLWAKV
jgi:hypothetical protein